MWHAHSLATSLVILVRHRPVHSCICMQSILFFALKLSSISQNIFWQPKFKQSHSHFIRLQQRTHAQRIHISICISNRHVKRPILVECFVYVSHTESSPANCVLCTRMHTAYIIIKFDSIFTIHMNTNSNNNLAFEHSYFIYSISILYDVPESNGIFHFLPFRS